MSAFKQVIHAIISRVSREKVIVWPRGGATPVPPCHFNEHGSLNVILRGPGTLDTFLSILLPPDGICSAKLTMVQNGFAAL